jgi:acetyltransferase-like isoleucine patch superfamily enzyme
MFHLLFKLINKWYFHEKISLCIRQVTIGKNSRFYPEAEVLNLQNRKDKIVIGENTHIRGELLIWPYGNGISIGNNSYVGKNTIIRAAEKIIIGSNVLISHNVMIIDSNSHEIDHIERAEGFKRLIKEGLPTEKGNVKNAPIIIEDYVWISYNVCILKGVTIGKGAIIGAGSVVTKNVPPFTLYAGNPAKFIRDIINTQ